jgi:hypothetical protein
MEPSDWLVALISRTPASWCSPFLAWEESVRARTFAQAMFILVINTLL